MEGKLRGAELPEEIFLNYVLFHRVNEEEIAPCRTFFRREIGERTGGMSFREAALEVNYWCAQELPIIVQMIVPCLHLPYTAEETEDAERNLYLPLMH